jgi:glycosyltransferase involved in cell wall biosynthesis
MQRLCVLLPAYNEAAGIASLIGRIKAVHLDGIELTVLVVNDGSRDDTAQVAAAAGAVVVSHPINRGVGAGFRTGLEWAREHGFDLLLHMDSDGQLLAEEIPEVVAPVAVGEADLAVGSRFIDGARPDNLARWKAFGLTSVARSIGLLTGYRLTDVSCGFRCMNRRVMEAIDPSFDYDYIQESLIQALAAHARVVEVPVTALYEGEGRGMSQRTVRYASRFLGLTAWSLAGFLRRRLFRGQAL